jgi:DNA-3-methyladenine glycosylase II
VALALLRAVAGQLIVGKTARQTELQIVRATTMSRDGLHAAPTARELGRLSPAELRDLGLGARRGATLVRVCRATDLESLKQLPGDAVARRLGRERGIGPWSLGVIFLEGLGRYDRGLARDLGLVKLMSALRGRWVEAEETDELLEPYGEWAGLASVYLLASYHAGLVPLPDANRNPRHRKDRRVAPRRAA